MFEILKFVRNFEILKKLGDGGNLLGDGGDLLGDGGDLLGDAGNLLDGGKISIKIGGKKV